MRSTRLIHSFTSIILFLALIRAGNAENLSLHEALGVEQNKSSPLSAKYEVWWLAPQSSVEKAPLFQRGEYSYDAGRVRLERSVFLKDGEDVATELKQLYAFDGERLRTLDTSFEDEAPNGYITSLTHHIADDFSPHAMLGRSLTHYGNRTLEESLQISKVDVITTESLYESLKGATRIEARVPIKTTGDASEFVDMHARLWIDPGKDYNVRRIEMYTRSANHEKYLRYVVENLEFAQVDGRWFPTRALQSWFPPETTLDSALQASAQPTTVQELKVSEWSTKPLPDELFTIDYPKGAAIWDDFIQAGYFAGETPSEWREAVDLAIGEGERLGLQAAVAISPGAETSAKDELIAASPQALEAELTKNSGWILVCVALALAAFVFAGGALYRMRRFQK